jgi:hypothetical protein
MMGTASRGIMAGSCIGGRVAKLERQLTDNEPYASSNLAPASTSGI